MANLVAHKLRAQNRNSSHQDIKDEAKSLVQSYMSAKPLKKTIELSDYYQDISIILESAFDTPLSFQLARQGFLEAIRIYNKKHNTHLDEPVVPVLAERDSLNIGYEWFVQGSQVSHAVQSMIGIWQRKRRFSTNDLIESAIFCSIVYGGINDIAVLRSLYNWMLGSRDVYRLDLPNGDGSEATQSLAVIILTVKDNSYGCYERDSNELISTFDSELSRYIEYIPDDMTLCFLYALRDKNVKRESIKSFDTLINDISKKLNLKNKDRTKPEYSQLIKYANYYWRQLEGSNLDNALSTTKQGKVKTTGLPKDKLMNYNRESINKSPKPLKWHELFEVVTAQGSTDSNKKIGYPAFSKNLIREIQEALKDTRVSSISYIEKLLNEFYQPNAKRILGWVRHLLNDKSINQESIAKYVGCIGRDWLMLTMDEDIKEWGSEEYETIYEQIIQSKVKDRRKNPVIKKESDLIDKLAGQTEFSYLNKLKDTQKFTYGRLRSFHGYQREYYDAPYVYFPWGSNRQVVKANIISPRIYHAMKAYIDSSTLEVEQKRLCLVVLSLAYRSGMRINELIGIKVSDIADIYVSNNGVKAEDPKIWLRPNRYRRLKSSSASRVIPLACLLKQDEKQLFIDHYHYQKRLKRTYLFSQGSGKQPFPSAFFSNMMKIIWDRLLEEHNFTFHSFRHTAISHLALVLRKSPLVSVMTDYELEQCNVISKGIIGYHQEQGAWFGLASFAGHLTCDTTFEHYIHTGHLLAGVQRSESKLRLPLTVLQAVTGLNYNSVYRRGATAYEQATKQVQLWKLRSYLVKKISVNNQSLFNREDLKDKALLTAKIENQTHLNEKSDSTFIHPKYYDVIAFLEELEKIGLDKRIKILPEVAIRHGISLSEARQLYFNASHLFDDSDKLLLGAPKGSNNQKLLARALDRAYQLSIEDPEALRTFVRVFSKKQNINSSSLNFGIKQNQKELIKQFFDVGCQLINASHWQIRASSEQAVTELKQSLSLDNQIRTGSRQNFHGYDVRVVQKKKRLSDKNLATSDSYYASSGVLKYLGYLLLILIN
ncbi:tyrosine-type recombinase/integrase [Psychrobacter aquimaris]|uniref:tyrosine-type recombinase/integrase n=1 Tax=Psychrobacter aquimaris TaxID=292733 RepID=UPI0039C62830